MTLVLKTRVWRFKLAANDNVSLLSLIEASLPITDAEQELFMFSFHALQMSRAQSISTRVLLYHHRS